MGATRTIKYASAQNSQDGANIEYSGAETWGQLKAELPKIAIAAQGMKPWVKSTTPGDNGYHLSSDTTALPAGDVMLYFLVAKNDSGSQK